MRKRINTIGLGFWLATVFAPLAFAQLPQPSTGAIQRLENFPSRFVSPRNIDAWLPEGYKPDKEYPVLYMHDGQMLFDSTTTWNGQEWGVDEILGRLIREKRIRPCIVVGVWNAGGDSISELKPWTRCMNPSSNRQMR